MKKIIGFIAMVVLLMNINFVYAAPVEVPSISKSEQGLIWSHKGGDSWLGDTTLSVGFEYEALDKRELSDYEGEVTANMIGGKIMATFGDRVGIYTRLGQAQDIEYKSQQLGSEVIFFLEDQFIWQIGVNGVIYEWEDSGIQIFGDGNYREISDIDYESVSVDGTNYSKSQLTGTKVEAEWQEWQIAVGISKKFDYFTPYAGIKYSDVDASAKATAGGTTYDAGSLDSDNNVGPFVGVVIEPVENISINLQGRFVDETAFSVGATVRF